MPTHCMRIVKIPTCHSVRKCIGAELAPDRVLQMTNELFLSEDGCLPMFETEEVKITGTIEETKKNIFAKAAETLQKTTKPLFLGGDHSISTSLVKAFSSQYQNPGIIIFDAHPDANNDFMPEGEDDLLLALVNQNIIRPSNIILVGTRNWDKTEIEFLQKYKIKYFPMKEIAAEGVQEISESIMAAAKGFGALYISIDIDVLDPAFAPGTGYPEPGGLTTRELLFFLHRLKRMHNLKAFDLVEINPNRDMNDMTSKVGAKILVELC